ncbi:hypothetical protein [Vulcanisaeta distributa]|uniref:hypothetical protein n=1 Tax=Vulcanisaeta distributa TaxID=164451 RepID=UPI001FB3BE8A|nr:hypothetical protein [Vulcanisaeta distributa]
MGFTVHGSNSPNEWGGRFTYVPAVTAVFNYTGFGLQVGVKLVPPQITGWRPPQPGNPSPPSSPPKPKPTTHNTRE